MMSVKNQGDIRQEVERLLRSPLSDTEWDYLVKHQHISEVESRVSSASTVAAAVREFRKAFRTSKKLGDSKTPVLPKSIAARQAALGAIYAYEANQDRDVKRMRNLVGPITEAQVLGWVAATHYASLDLTPNASHEDEVNALARAYDIGRGAKLETLWYLDSQRRRVLTVVDPLLSKLARLANTLAERWLFPEAEATNLIITGRVPVVWRYRGEVRLHLISRNPTSRIMLELDPDMSPVEVAEVYRRFRAELKGDRDRVRPLHERTAVLAGWVVSRPEDETWRARRLVWNREHPEWRCDSNSNFARDAHAAVSRLMNPGWRLDSARQ